MKKPLAALAACFLLGVPGAWAQPATAPSKAGAAKAAPAAMTTRWNVDAAQSSISFESSVSGQSFRGAFTHWTAFIAFDPANLGASRVRVVIDPGSAMSGDTSRDSTLKQGNWFDVAHFPQAIFEATSFRAVSATHYEARGTLEIKGRKTPVTLPFTLSIAGANAEMQGAISLNRRALGLGLDMADTMVPAPVSVTVRVKAARAP